MDINYKDRDRSETTLQLTQTLNRLIETLIKPEHFKRELFFTILLHVMRESGFILLKELGKPMNIEENIVERHGSDDYEALFVLTNFEATELKIIACFLRDIVLINATIPEIDTGTYSTCFNIDRYIQTSKLGIPMDFANFTELSISFKEKIVMPLKSSILSYYKFASGSLPGMPDDILHQILVSLPIRDILNLSETCKRINKVAKEESLWFQLYRRDYPSESKDDAKSWHDAYRNIYVVKQAEKFKLVRNVGAETFEEFAELSEYMRSVESRWEIIM